MTMQNIDKRNVQFRKACLDGNLEQVKVFILRGIDINSNESMSIQNASRSGNIDLIKYLIEKTHVKIDTAYLKDKCLVNAILSRNDSAINYIISVGGNINYKSVVVEIMNQKDMLLYDNALHQHECKIESANHPIDMLDIEDFFKKGLSIIAVDQYIESRSYNEELFKWWKEYKAKKQLYDTILNDMNFFEENGMIQKKDSIKKIKV